MIHPKLHKKFYGWTQDPLKIERVPEEDRTECRKCHGTDLLFEIGRARSASATTKAHGGKIGYRCQECRTLNPLKMENRRP